MEQLESMFLCLPRRELKSNLISSIPSGPMVKVVIISGKFLKVLMQINQLLPMYQNPCISCNACVSCKSFHSYLSVQLNNNNQKNHQVILPSLELIHLFLVTLFTTLPLKFRAKRNSRKIISEYVNINLVINKETFFFKDRKNTPLQIQTVLFWLIYRSSNNALTHCHLIILK